MISQEQQQQLQKYVNAFQTSIKDGADPHQLRSLLPEFYHFVDGCKVQVARALEQTPDLNDQDLTVAKGLLENLTTLHSSLLDTARQLGVELTTKAHTLTADHKTQEIHIDFEQCNQDSIKNVVLQAIRDTLNVEAPLANAEYTVEMADDHSIVVHVLHCQDNQDDTS